MFEKIFHEKIYGNSFNYKIVMEIYHNSYIKKIETKINLCKILLFKKLPKERLF